VSLNPSACAPPSSQKGESAGRKGGREREGGEEEKKKKKVEVNRYGSDGEGWYRKELKEWVTERDERLKEDTRRRTRGREE
jgi:hypothetical protein